MIFQSKFETDIDTPEELAAAYPFIRADKPETITVKDGVLVKKGVGGKCQVNEVSEGLENCTDVTYHLSITCDRERFNVGLGCYVGEGRARNRFAFHPGMRGGEFRVEGPGGCWNEDIGFTPPAVEAGEGGCRFAVVLNQDGNHSVTITHPKGAEQGSYTKKWTNPGLWTEDMAKSPSFGFYDGDIQGRGCVHYQDFAASSATARVRALTLETQRLEGGRIQLALRGLAGDVVHTLEADATSSVEALYASLDAALSGPVKLVRPDASLLDRAAGQSTLEAALGLVPEGGGVGASALQGCGGGAAAAKAPPGALAALLSVCIGAFDA